MNPLKISFDFDETLDKPIIQNLCKKFIKNKNDVYITSNRRQSDAWNQDVFATAYLLGIPKENIRIIGSNAKSLYLKDFDIHFDDNKIDINDINNNTFCIGILI